MTHEMGHIMGLAHITTTGYQSVMYIDVDYIYSTWGRYTPSSVDTSNINALYP